MKERILAGLKAAEIDKLIRTKQSGMEMGEEKSNPLLNSFCQKLVEYFITRNVEIPNNGKWIDLTELFNKIIQTQGGPNGTYLLPCKES